MAKKGFANIMNSIQQEISVTINKNPNETTNTIDVEENKLGFGLEKKSDDRDTETLSVKLTNNIKEAFKNESDTTNKTNSAIATEVLRSIFDEKTKTFTITIPKNEIVEKKSTTLNLPKDIKEALVNNAKLHNMKTYEYFNKLIEELLK